GDGLGGRSGEAWAIEAKNFRGRTAGCVQRAFGVDAEGPEIRSVRIGDQTEFGSEFEAAITADSHAAWSAFEEIFIRGLAPGTGVLGLKRKRSGSNEVKK